MIAAADVDLVLSLPSGDYEIHVTLDDQDRNEADGASTSKKTLQLSVRAQNKDGSAIQSTVHPLLRAVVGRGSAFVEAMDEHYDATQHHVVARSTLELHTFLRLVSARGDFHVYSHPLSNSSANPTPVDLSPASLECGRVPPRVLIIAGSDSGGGAGVQADVKACTNLGVFSTTAITAVTVQNTQGVHGIHAIPVNTIADQITCVLDDIGTDVVKVRVRDTVTWLI